MKPNLSSAKKDRRGLRTRFAVVLALGALLALPIAASALHWPNFGGDAGHSGNQPVRPAEMGVEFLHRQTDTGTIRTSIVTSGGDEASGQRVSYGKFVNPDTTADDDTLIHIRDLATGAEKVPPASAPDAEEDRNIDDDIDGNGDEPGSDDRALGIGNDIVTPVSSSAHGGLGQLYVVHNDENSTAAAPNGCNPASATSASQNDIAIAQFDEATGAQLRDFAVGQARGNTLVPDPTCTTASRPQVTDGYVIESSPVITPPLDPSGRRLLFFVARYEGTTAGQTHRLFRIEIGNAGATTATIGAVSPQFRNIPNLNTTASPSVGYFRDKSSGFVLPYVFVSVNAAAGASDIVGYKAEDISDPGEVDLETPADLAGNPQTVSIPVSEDGELPGPSTGDVKAPALYAAFHDPGPEATADDDRTIVRKFVQTGDNDALTLVATSADLPGAPAPGLALSSVVSDGQEQAGGQVIVTTGRNLYLLNASNLATADLLRDSGESPLDPGSSGFSRNVPLTSGGFVFVQDDGGIPYVLGLDDAERVSETDFLPDPAHLESDFGFGQPSYSNGFLQYMTDRGLFVYQTGIFFPPNTKPVARFTAAPNPANVNQAVTFDATGSNDPDSKPLTYEWDFDGDGVFEVNRGTDPRITVSFPVPRTYDVSLRVTDEPLERTAAQSDTTTVPVVINSGPPNVPPTASFTATPNPALTSRQVVYDASASRDTDGSIVRYEWDLDGNGSFETNSGSNPRTQRAYSTPAVYNVKLRVTDNAGTPVETTRQVTVTRAGAPGDRKRPRSLSATTRPTRDRALPYVFRTTGRLRLPSGVTRRNGCTGRVTVTVKAGKKTISRRTTRLRRTCTYRSSVTFRDRTRLGRASRLRIIVRYQGNRFLTPKSARTRSVRIG